MPSIFNSDFWKVFWLTNILMRLKKVFLFNFFLVARCSRSKKAKIDFLFEIFLEVTFSSFCLEGVFETQKIVLVDEIFWFILQRDFKMSCAATTSLLLSNSKRKRSFLHSSTKNSPKV